MLSFKIEISDNYGLRSLFRSLFLRKNTLNFGRNKTLSMSPQCDIFIFLPSLFWSKGKGTLTVYQCLCPERAFAGWCCACIGNRLFYFLIRYKKTQKKSKINFPQFLRCMYVCMCVYVRSTGHTVWRMELKFLPRYLCQYSLRCRDCPFKKILNFGGVMPLFRHFRKNIFS